jgi:hypothetical protein
MNHKFKGILIAIAITSMLASGATTMFPIMQNSFADKDNTTSPTTGTVKIDLVPGNEGDTEDPTAYNVYVSGKNANPYSFQLSLANPNIRSSQVVTLDPGFYSVTSDSNIHFFYTSDCKTTISAGQNLQCHILFPIVDKK